MQERTLERLWALHEEISKEVLRVLRDGGTYTVAELVYEKKKGKFKKIKTIDPKQWK